MDVVLVRWPTDEHTRARLREDGVPRVLLVEGGSPPPAVSDELEDWIRVPADEVDLHARVDAIARRARDRSEGAPNIDDDGVLRVGGAWTPLPPVEARLTAALLERTGAV